MRINTKQALLTLSVLTNLTTFSQTVNNGELYITPGTIMSTVGALDNKPAGDIINDGDLYVYSHYNNDGLVTFTSGSTTGATHMKGLVNFQDISGSVPMEWYDGEFNNNNVQPAFHLSNEVSISGTSDFQQGIIDDDNFGGLLVFENTANHINVKDESHVDGKVRKNGTDSFQYPIGDGGQFRHASISPPGADGDAFTGKYFWDNSNPLYPHANKPVDISLIDDQEYWTIDRTAGNNNIFLTLSWDDDTTPASISASPYDEIHIVRWDAALNIWVDEVGAADPLTKEITMMISPLSKYGVFTLARGKGIVGGCETLNIHNAFTPDGDGINEDFILDNITTDCYKDNTMEIYNRWGVKVYSADNYNNTSQVFNGYSNARATLNQEAGLPTGTYFYVLKYRNSGKTSTKTGWLYLARANK